MISVNPLAAKMKRAADSIQTGVETQTGTAYEPSKSIIPNAENAAPAPTMTMRETPTPGMVGDPKPASTTFSSTSGDNVKSYIDAKSATLGQDPGYTTEAGSLYAQRTTDGLKTPDASSVNAQNTEDTAASRRAYLARVQSEEAIGQSGFGAGTAQADRMRSTSDAGVNAANQQGQNSVNAYLRQRTEDNMNRARDLEAGQYNKGRDNLADAQGQNLMEYGMSEKATDRGLDAAKVVYNQGRDAIGDARYNESYADTRKDVADTKARTAERDAAADKQQAIENKTVLDGNDETAKRNLLAGLPEGSAKNAVMAGLADGSLTTATALAKVMNPDGTIKDEYAGKTPGALGMEAEKEYAEQTVALKFPNLAPGTAAYLEKVNAEILAMRTAKTNPINDETKARTVADARTKLNLGETLTPEETKLLIDSKDIPSFTISQGELTGKDAVPLLGKKVAIDQAIYTIKSQHNVEKQFGGSIDYSKVEDAQGNIKYIYLGAIHDTPPGNKEIAR